MNILFFITPKSEVACVYEDDSLRQALERMEYHQYASVPMLRRDGKYVGTLTEGDLLWGIKNQYNLTAGWIICLSTEALIWKDW